MEIQPFGDRVVVRVLDTSETSEGGILVRPKSKEDSNEGIVVAVGEGTVDSTGKRIPLLVKPDDRILFAPGAGIKIYTCDKDLLRILPVRDIYCKIVKGED